MVLMEYSAREWFLLRHGIELWEVHPSDLIRYQVCREVAEKMTGRNQLIDLLASLGRECRR